jgi:ferritin
MISDRLREFLIDQIGHELTAHQDYMGIAVHFRQQSLLRWARFFRDQAVEEAQHATRIMDFLVDNEVEFDLPPLSGATSQYESALAAAQAALASERNVSARFREASQLALAEGDAPTLRQSVLSVPIRATCELDPGMPYASRVLGGPALTQEWTDAGAAGSSGRAPGQKCPDIRRTTVRARFRPATRAGSPD